MKEWVRKLDDKEVKKGIGTKKTRKTGTNTVKRQQIEIYIRRIDFSKSNFFSISFNL